MNRVTRSVSAALGVVLAGCLVPSGVSAQSLPFGLTSVESTRPLSIVQESPYPPLRGQLLKAGEDTITLIVDGHPVDVPLARVTRIDVGGDSLLNGALIGAAAMGGWCAAVCGQGLTRRGSLPFAVLVNGGVGALIGAGIDRLNGRGRPIYVRPSRGGLALEMGLRF
jgi:hypothetical protein